MFRWNRILLLLAWIYLCSCDERCRNYYECFIDQKCGDFVLADYIKWYKMSCAGTKLTCSDKKWLYKNSRTFSRRHFNCIRNNLIIHCLKLDGKPQLLMRTQYNKKWNMNVPLDQKESNAIIEIQYSCSKNITKSNYSEILHEYDVVRNDGKVEKCSVENINCSCEEQPNSGDLTVNTTIRISEHQKDLKVDVKLCYNMLMIAPKVENKDVPHTYKFDRLTINYVPRQPLELTLTDYSTHTMVAKIIINIERVKSDLNFCKYKCKNCSCEPVPFYQMVGSCSKSSSKRESRQVYFPNICLRKPQLCQDLCYQTPNCEYFCGKMINNRTVETKYIVRLHKWTSNGVGSKSWKWNEIPLNMTVFNECNYSLSLCYDPLTKMPMPKSCVDTDDGFNCTQNSKINHTLCTELKMKALFKKVPYWKCPQEVSEKNSQQSWEDEMKNKIKNPENVEQGFNLLNKRNQEKISRKEKANAITAFLTRVEDVISYSSVNKFRKSGESKMNKTTNVLLYVIQRVKPKETIQLNRETSVTFNMGNKSRSPIVSAVLFLQDIGDEMKYSQDIIQNLEKTFVTPNETGLRRISPIMSVTAYNSSADVNLTFMLKCRKSISQNWLTKLELKCGFRNITNNEWSTKGCRIVQSNPPRCTCNHMTNFAYLVHIQPINEHHKKPLTVLSIFGGTLNCLGLLLFMIFALFINPRDKLQLDLFNVALCLFLGVLVYLFSGLFTGLSVMCKLVAMLAEFLLLSAFFWKLVIGISVVRKISTMHYQEDYLKKYPYIFVGICYGVSLLVVILSGSIGREYYGSIGNEVCWIQASSPPYIIFLVLISCVVAINLVCAALIAKVLLVNYINTRKTKMNNSNELFIFLQLFVTMGCTWMPLYLATKYLAAAYIMVIFMPLQGVLMFLLVVVIDKVNRDKVSSFLVSLTSRSSSSTDKTLSKSKSTSNPSKGTEQSDNLLFHTNTRCSTNSSDFTSVSSPVPETTNPTQLLTTCDEIDETTDKVTNREQKV